MMRALFDSAVDAIITIDSNGIIHSFNNKATELFGFTNEEVIGRNVNILMPEPYRSNHRIFE